MPSIELSGGYSTRVSQIDYGYLNRWNWQTLRTRNSVYAVRHVRTLRNGRRIRITILMHRVIATRMRLRISRLIDHVDRDGLNNLRRNIRTATHQQNAWNTQLWAHNTSGYKGVHWCNTHRVWIAKMQKKRKVIFIGRFSSIEEAVAAYKKTERRLRGKYAA